MRPRDSEGPAGPESVAAAGIGADPVTAWPQITDPGMPIGRRVLLGMLGLGVVGVVAGRRIQDGVDVALQPLTRYDPSGLSALIPGGNYFRIYTVTSGYPTADPVTYSLRVDGRVDRPLQLSVADLRAMPATSMVRDFQCVTGWRVTGVHWTGVRLSDLLDAAGVQPSGMALRFESFDGTYTESLTMAQARRADVIVAHSMLGAPVTREHGGPVRLYVAPMYGYSPVSGCRASPWSTRWSPVTGSRWATTTSTPGWGRAMAEATSRRPDAPTERQDDLIERFDRTERWLHTANGVLFAILLLTGAALYFSPLMALVGRRHLVELIHLGAGLALPLSVLASLPGPWGRALRSDLRRFNRWSADDRAWMRAAVGRRRLRDQRRAVLLDGKFNAGQKLNSAFTGGVIGVMLLTGVVMYWYHPYPLSWRTGATYTHDWITAAVVVVVAGHISYALRDPDALRSIWRGTIARRWAARHARGWLAEVDASASSSASSSAPSSSESSAGSGAGSGGAVSRGGRSRPGRRRSRA